jgi:hypothetical protein
MGLVPDAPTDHQPRRPRTAEDGRLLACWVVVFGVASGTVRINRRCREGFPPRRSNGSSLSHVGRITHRSHRLPRRLRASVLSDVVSQHSGAEHVVGARCFRSLGRCRHITPYSGPNVLLELDDPGAAPAFFGLKPTMSADHGSDAKVVQCSPVRRTLAM